MMSILTHNKKTCKHFNQYIDESNRIGYVRCAACNIEVKCKHMEFEWPSHEPEPSMVSYTIEIRGYEIVCYLCHKVVGCTNDT